MTQERLDEIKKIKEATQLALKGKAFKNLSTGDKDKLLETISKSLGLIK